MLALVLRWLSGGVLQSVLGHLEKRRDQDLGSEKLKTDIALETIKAELETRREQTGIIKNKLSHRVAWLPMTIIEFAAAFYFVAIIVDIIWQLPGDVAALPATEAALLSVIFGGMFLSRK